MTGTAVATDLRQLAESDLLDMYGEADDATQAMILAEAARRDRSERMSRWHRKVQGDWRVAAHADFVAAEAETRGYLLNRKGLAKLPTLSPCGQAANAMHAGTPAKSCWHGGTRTLACQSGPTSRASSKPGQTMTGSSMTARTSRRQSSRTRHKTRNRHRRHTVDWRKMDRQTFNTQAKSVQCTLALTSEDGVAVDPRALAGQLDMWADTEPMQGDTAAL